MRSGWKRVREREVVVVEMGSITRKEREREIRDHAILSSRLSIPLVISLSMIDPLTQTHRSPNFVRRKRGQ